MRPLERTQSCAFTGRGAVFVHGSSAVPRGQVRVPRMRSGRVGVVSLDSRRLIDDPDAQMAKGFNSAVIVPLGAVGGEFGAMANPAAHLNLCLDKLCSLAEAIGAAGWSDVETMQPGLAAVATVRARCLAVLEGEAAAACAPVRAARACACIIHVGLARSAPSARGPPFIRFRGRRSGTRDIDSGRSRSRRVVVSRSPCRRPAIHRDPQGGP